MTSIDTMSEDEDGGGFNFAEFLLRDGLTLAIPINSFVKTRKTAKSVRFASTRKAACAIEVPIESSQSPANDLVSIRR